MARTVVLPDWQNPELTHRNREDSRPLLIRYADDGSAICADRAVWSWYQDLNVDWLFYYAESVSLVPPDAAEHDADDLDWDAIPVLSVWQMHGQRHLGGARSGAGLGQLSLAALGG